MKDYSEPYLVRKHPDSVKNSWTFYAISVNVDKHAGAAIKSSYDNLGDPSGEYPDIDDVVNYLKSLNDGKGIILHKECQRVPSDVA